MADALIVPGGNFGPGAGMLMYAAAVAEHRGATVTRHEWPAERVAVFQPPAERWVADQIAPLTAADSLLIGKSLGSYAATVAADCQLPAVWLTPILTVPWVPAALSRATQPFLLVGGTADQWWDGDLARHLTSHVVEIEHADHGLMVPGPVTGSIDVLRRVVAAIDDFLGAIGWPG